MKTMFEKIAITLLGGAILLGLALPAAAQEKNHPDKAAGPRWEKKDKERPEKPVGPRLEHPEHAAGPKWEKKGDQPGAEGKGPAMGGFMPMIPGMEIPEIQQERERLRETLQKLHEELKQLRERTYQSFREGGERRDPEQRAKLLAQFRKDSEEILKKMVDAMAEHHKKMAELVAQNKDKIVEGASKKFFPAARPGETGQGKPPEHRENPGLHLGHQKRAEHQNPHRMPPAEGKPGEDQKKPEPIW